MRNVLVFAIACSVLACGTGATRGPSEGPATVERNVRIGFEGGELALRTTEERRVQVDTVGLGPDETWAFLPLVFDDLEIPLTTVNGEAKLLGAVETRVRSRLGKHRLARLLRCGTRPTGPVADRYEVYLTAVSQVEPLEDGRSLVVTHVAAKALPGGYSGNAIRCATTGRLEQAIVGRLMWRASDIEEGSG